MSIEFVSQEIWPQLTRAVRGSRQRCAVAVAYFGAGASRLLPLPKGSRLVVDASERSVASGQTCPADLIKLTKRGVSIFSVPNLHAKVFVLGRTAYIGSTNVSSRSASHLVEAVIRTTEPGAVDAAREFVQQHCLHELTPTVLKRLAKLYRPPLIPGGKPGKRQQARTSKRPALPRLFLAQLHFEDWSERDQTLHDSALAVAEKRRKHPRSFELDSFRNTGKCIYQRGDVIIQVLDEGNGNILVAPPGNVLHVRTRRDGKKQVSFIYLERPARRRRPIKSLARTIGCTQKQLRRNGMVRDRSFAQALLSTWVIEP
ncbi:MAG: phospholipase D family protein [Gammaproteobacteria bacterium]|nr:phospholipase D family protein [Gammaproteobacteria bacterium]